MQVDSEWDWLSVNLWPAFVLFEFLYMFGYASCVFDAHLRRVYTTSLAPNAPGVVLLLLSALWPVITFWGARSLRRIGPWVSFYDRTQRHLGLLRTWAWMGVMVKFATTFANGPVSVRLHRHLTQSAMVLYIFHRLSEQLWLTAVKRHIGVSLDRMGLCWLLIFAATLSPVCCSMSASPPTGTRRKCLASTVFERPVSRCDVYYYIRWRLKLAGETENTVSRWPAPWGARMQRAAN